VVGFLNFERGFPMTEVTNVITIADAVGISVNCKTFATRELANDYCREELSMTESEIENGEYISCDGSFDCYIKTTKIEGESIKIDPDCNDANDKHNEEETGLTPDQIENYIGTPDKCPFCGSDDISADSPEPMDFDSDMTADIKCHNCGKEWREFYRLYTINEIE